MRFLAFVQGRYDLKYTLHEFSTEAELLNAVLVGEFNGTIIIARRVALAVRDAEEIPLLESPVADPLVGLQRETEIPEEAEALQK